MRKYFLFVLFLICITLFSGQAFGEVISEGMSVEEEISVIESRLTNSTTSELKFLETFVPNDKTSNHYRTEFRLNAYNDATGYAYTFGSAKLDVVIIDDLFYGNLVRVYLDAATFDECCDLIALLAPVMDEAVSNEDIADTINYLNEWKEANGYYISDLKLLLLGNDRKGYELMLSMF